MTDTIHLALPCIDAAQAQKHVTHNEALLLLDAVTQLSVIDRRASPPSSPVDGDRYLVVATAAGAFAGKEQKVAIRLGGAWAFLAPKAGWLAFVEAEQRMLLCDGSAWIDAGLALRELAALSLLGVGTTADAANPLSVKASAALFAARTIAEGGAGDFRVKLEKETAANTASQLYQSNWFGRAETGLLGDDDFHVKVSADGTTWREAMIVDRSTGRVAFPNGMGDGASVAFRNRLRNAAFAINQRAVSGTVSLAAGQYGHDGVKAGASGASYTFTTSGVDTTLSISAGSLILPIEAQLMEGGSYALAHDGSAQARVWQGAGYSGSGSYATASRSAPLLVFGLTTNAQTNVEFSGGSVLRPQFEPGVYATSFERRPPGVELSMCQRYFQALLVSHLFTANAGTQFGGSVMTLPATMFGTPTLSALSGGVQTNVLMDGLNTMGKGAVRYFMASTAAGSVEAYNRAFTASAEI
ncbi:DUF2793 domain-containing protein [Methylosinus sporium]|uniref:DUF2793 domain-containing protein n=1 Tax=Methylosinus sporium TaxID=428 RepID=UPI00383B8B7F